MMQFLWRYVDELVGKGLEMSVLAQFFFYSALTLIPLSLPLAILLAALMTFGNFGERYELLSMKAAGIPLLRIIRPLIIFCTFLCCTSFYFQNVIAPKAQIKLLTLLVSMKQTSPELDIPEGVFYDEIEGYNIYVKAECVVTDEDNGILEIKNIAVDPQNQGQGYGKALIDFLASKYADEYSILQVGTGDSPLTVPFYEKCGFVRSHNIPNFFTDNYDHPIYECGVQLIDMVYLQRCL